MGGDEEGRDLFDKTPERVGVVDLKRSEREVMVEEVSGRGTARNV